MTVRKVAAHLGLPEPGCEEPTYGWHFTTRGPVGGAHVNVAAVLTPGALDLGAAS